MKLDQIFDILSKQLVNEVIEKVRNENIIKLDQESLSPVISQHRLAKELHKSDTWVHNYILFNPRYSTEIQAMIDSGALQLKGNERIQVRVNRTEIKEFLQRHSNELPWLKGD